MRFAPHNLMIFIGNLSDGIIVLRAKGFKITSEQPLMAGQEGCLQEQDYPASYIQDAEFVMTVFRDSSQVDSMYLDFSKAFNSVNHRLLIAKLEGHGVCESLLQWPKSY
ncbi:hypothetical protein J6590_052474 [Homalodisca vitripennis]|nr:hypothetical protein J6590_052474 [Homalodisca vitripennis]